MRALAHPLRVRIVSLLTGTPMSAAEVARELGISHANATYHVKVLREAGELVQAGQVRIRGGLANRYVYPRESANRSGEDFTREEHIAYVHSASREIERRLESRGSVSESFTADLSTHVPVDVWRRALELMQETARLLHDNAQGRAAPNSISISATTFAFEIEEPT